jgi:hypothetical protein
MRTLISAALVAVLMAPAAQAQQHQHGQPQGQGQKPQMGQHQMDGMQGGMQGGMQMGGGLPGPLRELVPFAPDNVLKMKDMLELSADQEKQLTELAARAKKAGDEAHAPAEAAMQGLRTEMEKLNAGQGVDAVLPGGARDGHGEHAMGPRGRGAAGKALLTDAQ